MLFDFRSDRTLLAHRSVDCIFRMLLLSHHDIAGTSVFVAASTKANATFYLRYRSASGVSLALPLQLVNINLIRCMGAAALAGPYLAEIVPQYHLFLPEKKSSPLINNAYCWSAVSGWSPTTFLMLPPRPSFSYRWTNFIALCHPIHQLFPSHSRYLRTPATQPRFIHLLPRHRHLHRCFSRFTSFMIMFL